MRTCWLIVVGLIAGLVLAPEASAPAADAIKTGVQLPLTGERAPVGQIIKGSVEMAVQHVNGTGGVNGASIAAVYADSQNSAEGAAAAARALAGDLDVVAILGELFSPFALASRDVVEAADVPYLIGGTSPRTTENAEWVYRVGASDALLAELIARYVVQDLKLRRIAVLSSRVGVHNARAELVVKVLKEKYGLTPTVRETWKPDDRDFTAQLEKPKPSRPMGSSRSARRARAPRSSSRSGRSASGAAWSPTGTSAPGASSPRRGRRRTASSS